jgi:hypothetical protein
MPNRSASLAHALDARIMARCHWAYRVMHRQNLYSYAGGRLHDGSRVTSSAPPIFFLCMEDDICRELDMRMENGNNAPVISPIEHMYDIRDASGVCTDNNADCK